MSRRVRDSQRSKLYAAERQVPGFETDDRLETVPEIEAFVRVICNSPWFRREWPHVQVPIYVHDGRRHRCAKAYAAVAPGKNGWWWNGSPNTIAMPRWSRSKMIVLHEVAHFCAPRPAAGHGREFAAAYLALVRHFLGASKFRLLRTAFVVGRVKYKPKRAGVSRGNPEALRRWREAKAASARDGGAVPA